MTTDAGLKAAFSSFQVKFTPNFTPFRNSNIVERVSYSSVQTATGVLNMARTIVQREFKTAPSVDIDSEVLKCFRDIMKVRFRWFCRCVSC